VRALTPTSNKRLNELVGFVGATVATLLALSLLSYSPRDNAFNVAGPAIASHPARNWIGPVGAHIADLAFQLCGYAAFLFPIAFMLLALHWLRSRPIETPVAKVFGTVLMFLALPAEMALLAFPEVRGALPPGGLLGALGSGALRSALNPVGAHLVGSACLLTALFLTTRFSFATTASWIRSPMAGDGMVGRWVERWRDYREQREDARLRKKVDAIKVGGRPPAAPQTIALRSAVLDDEVDEDVAAGISKTPSRAPTVIKFHEPEKAAAKRAAGPAKNAEGRTNFKLPPIALLHQAERGEQMQEAELKECAKAIEEKSEEFDVKGHITQINPGPVVTTYEFKPEAGIKYSRVTGLADDLCLALKAESLLIERIPGKSTVGIEVPNRHRETITLREVVESPEFSNTSTKLAIPLGKDLIGRLRATDLALMPHLLIAGSTGTGKSVFINALIMGILFRSTPDEVRIVLVDPKRLELGLYEDIPHLFTPVVTDARVAANVLRNAVREMERRLKLLAQRSVRNIDQYNRTFEKQGSLALFPNDGEDEHKPLPYIVIVIDELADLMMVDTNGVEESITRLAQMARAVGIHLVLATQRPSVDVITGLIKANFPARISFRVATKVDSRTILDTNGSESLLGKGDMLFLPAGTSRLHRIHGPYVTEEEVTAVCTFWRDQAKAIYNEELLKPPKDEDAGEDEGGDVADGGGAVSEDVDGEMYDKAVRVVCEMGRASTSTLQRRLRVGYGRAARLIDMMEKDGIVGPPDGAKAREVLKSKSWMREFDDSIK